MKPYVIGLALAVVILAAGLLAPALLPSTTRPSTLRALEETELARRHLHAHSPGLSLLEPRSAVEELKEADLDRLVERSQEDFAAHSKEFNQHVRRAQTVDRDAGMPEPELRAIPANAAGVRSAVAGLERLLSDNRQWLAKAAQFSRTATEADRDALGVGQVAGMVKLAEAAELLAEARRRRAELVSEQTRTFAAAANWAAARAVRDHYGGLDVTGIRNGLDADLAEIEEALSETQVRVDELAQTVAQREEALARVREELRVARAERLSMEEAGFAVGEDASFEEYRAKYLQIAQLLLKLQEEEQLLAFGGVRGGRVAGGDLLTGEIEGGETVLGLAELRRRLAVATDKRERYARARQALVDQIELADAVGVDAETQEEHHTARLEAFRAEVEEHAARMAEQAQQAFEREDAALRAARAAVKAFGDADAAVQKWKNDAQDLQRRKDPQRANERLRQIVDDDYAPAFASAGEARAKTLIGRIHTERALGLAGYLDTLDRIEKLMPGSAFDIAALEESLNTARDEATQTLGEAREVYERLARENERQPGGVYYRSSLAAVYHLLWQIDEFNADQHRSVLIEELAKALEGARQSPHLQQQVALHALLTGGAETPAPRPEEEEPAAEEEQAEEPGEPNAP